MRVLHVFNSLKFSGAEIMYVSAAKNFKNKGCSLFALATDKDLGDYTSHFEKANFKIRHLPITSNGFIKRLKFCCDFIKLINKEKIDVIHIHSSSLRLVASICAFITKKTCVYTFHNVFKSSWYSYHYHILQRWVIKTLLKTKFQTISDSVYENELNLYHNETNLIYNWFNNNKFYPASEHEKIEARKSLGIPIDAKVSIIIGGCSHIKRHEDLIYAHKTILKDFPNSICLHLGEGDSTSEELKLVKELNIEDSFRFYGNQDNVRQYLIASDIYVMTSKFEGISLTTIEAMACNVPAILYDVIGLRDFNKGVKCSTQIQENHDLLAQEIIKHYSSPKQETHLTANALEMVNEKYNMEKNVPKIYLLY